MNAYKSELLEIIEKYNCSRKIKKSFSDKMYLKIFLANSDVAEPNYDLHSMPNFNNMLAFIWLNRVEKAFKQTLKVAGQNKIEKYFVVSQDQFNEANKILVNANEFSLIDVYYKIC
jgi:hypothetical protein